MKPTTYYPATECDVEGHCKCWGGTTEGPNAHAHLHGEAWRCCFCGTFNGSPGREREDT